jgi:bifunctional N-acetylglucosamine-1-phosphate-uridyltransferase/glucosamine-1-phosphate-acetyltransferase GlmU-like protein
MRPRTPTGRPLVVYSPPTAAIVEVFADRADFALQESPLGTADAVKAALAVAPADVAEVLVLSGDVPLVDPDCWRSCSTCGEPERR